MFKHQSVHISIMNTGHEMNLTAILNLYVPLTLSTSEVHTGRESYRHSRPICATDVVGYQHLCAL